jgi:hypothetical protein
MEDQIWEVRVVSVKFTVDTGSEYCLLVEFSA